MLPAAIGVFLSIFQSTGQPLSADPIRDRDLHLAVQGFFNSEVTADRLDTRLREYAQQFESRPYKVGRLAIDLSTAPKERLDKWGELVAAIIGPTLQAFHAGKISSAEAAIKVAPFVLVFGGPYGFDQKANPDPDWLLRSAELNERISAFAAP